MTWREKLALIRDRMGLTQTEIAAQVGCSQSTITDLYRGKIRSTNYEYALAIDALVKTALRRKARA